VTGSRAARGAPRAASMSDRPGESSTLTERNRDTRGSSIGYTRASCFSELLGLPSPSPHQSLALTVHVPVESSPSRTVHDMRSNRCRCRSRERPIRRSRSWAAWRVRGLRHETAVRPRLRVIGLVIAVVVGLVTLGLGLLRDS
jgi:hypothetical protein